MAGVRNRVVEVRRMRASELLANPANWRTHPSEQQATLAAVADEVGFAGTMLAYYNRDGALTLVDGHLRAQLFPDLDVDVAITDLTEEEAATILATYDPIGAMAGRDEGKLIDLLNVVNSATESADIHALLEAVANGEASPMPFPTPPRATEDESAADKATNPMEADGYVATAQRGQVWAMGDHRLMCGDSTDEGDVALLLDGATALLVVADPPYGMGKENDGIANDNLYREKLDAFQMAWWRAARPHVDDNGSAYIWGKPESLWRLWYVGGLRDSEPLTFKNEITWWKGGGKTVGVGGSRMYDPSERCLFFMLGAQSFNNNADNYWPGWESIRLALVADVERMGWTAADLLRITSERRVSRWLGKSHWTFIPEHHYASLQDAAGGEAFNDYDALKREHAALKLQHDALKQDFYESRASFDNTHDNMTDVWSFPRVTGEERYDHATPKPVAIQERIIMTSSPAGATIYDPFCGTGPVLIAAERLGRRCYAMEIEPRYIDATIARWEAYTGKTAELVTDASVEHQNLVDSDGE